MKSTLAFAAIFFIAAASPLQQKQPQPQEDFGLPALHEINTATLSPSYSCRSESDFQQGYQDTALFLSKESRTINGPDLLFDGACKSEDYFEGSTAGDDMSLIADLGQFPLEKLSAHLVFNTRNVHSADMYSKFMRTVRVQAKHTYAVLINKRDVRGLFVFTVDDYVPNKSVHLRYAVKEYQLLNTRSQTEGFAWEAPNH